MSDKQIPQGYKKTEIGVIPEDWEVKRLGEIVTKVIDNRGKTPYYNERKGIELIETASISNVIRFPDYKKVEKFVTNYTYKTWFRAHPQEKDLLISTVGEYAGSSAIMGSNRGTIAQNLIGIRVKLYDPFFIFYWTRANQYNKQLKKVMMNQAQPSLKVPWLLEFKISLPPFSEQRAIARILSDIDTLIENLDKLIEKKKNIKKGTMQELLTGKKRLPGFKKKKGYKKTEIGVIPEDWEVKRLGEVLKYEQPTKYIVKNTNYLEKGFVPVLTPGKTFILGYTKEKEEIYRDVPIILFDDFTTDTKYVIFPFKVKSSALKILKLRDDNYDLRFIYEKIQLIDYSIGEGDHKRRWIAEYQHTKIAVPPITEQYAIAQILSDMDAEIEALERKKEKYEMLKKGAMELLLTGKVRVKEKNEMIEVLK
jgi:type I restriction enzyme S subunit